MAQFSRPKMAHCGTGTSVLEAKLRKVTAIGVEMNPVAALASRVKTSFEVDLQIIKENARHVSEKLQAYDGARYAASLIEDSA